MARPAARKTRRTPKRGPYARSGETRERLLAAALEVAGEVGIHRASVARIAQRAGVAVGNLHYHFGSREELLRELMQSVVGELLAELRGATEASPDFFATEEAAFRTYLAFIHRNPAYVRLSEEVRLHHPALYAEGIAMWLAQFREALGHAVARGELRPMDEGEVAAVAHFLLGARYFMDQMIDGVDGRAYPGDDAVVAAHMRMVRGGLAGAAPATSAPVPGPALPRAPRGAPRR